MAEINVCIDEETGDLIADGEGFPGPACEDAMKHCLSWQMKRKPEYEAAQRRQTRNVGR